MDIISLINTAKLVKGGTYIAQSFNNMPISSTTPPAQARSLGRFRKVFLRGYGSFQCKDFTDIQGNPLPQINYTNNTPNPYSLKVSDIDLKKGDIVVCKSDNYKFLVKEAKYRVVDIDEVNKWNTKVKFEGYKRWIRFGSYNFRKLSLQETRDIALSQIFDKSENFSVEFVRKFERESNKDKILIESIAKSIVDPHRNHLNILDWCIQKKARYQQLTKEDFEKILNKPLVEILSIYENSLT